MVFGMFVKKHSDKALQKNHNSCQAVANKHNIGLLPKEHESICRLERVLTIKPKGKSLKVNGRICNIVVNDFGSTCKSLRRHVLFEPARPMFFEKFLKFLKYYSQ